MPDPEYKTITISNPIRDDNSFYELCYKNNKEYTVGIDFAKKEITCPYCEDNKIHSRFEILDIR